MIRGDRGGEGGEAGGVGMEMERERPGGVSRGGQRAEPQRNRKQRAKLHR